MNNPLDTVSLCGLELHKLDYQQTLAHVREALCAGVGGWLFSVNLDVLRQWASQPDMRRLTETTTLRLADGMPLIWASQVQGQPLPERVPGSDLLTDLTGVAAATGHGVYFLGGAPGVADATARHFQARFPDLQVAGTACPPLGFEHSESAWEDMQQALAAASPSLVFVALGAPKQELVISRFQTLFPKIWWVGVGGSFDFVTGKTKRAPRWMQVSGLEWVHRLAHEPRRLARRYLIDDIPFALRLFVRAVRARLA